MNVIPIFYRFMHYWLVHELDSWMVRGGATERFEVYVRREPGL